MNSRRSRGLYICIVGPDGCGKSTLSRQLAVASGAAHSYWRPGLLPMPQEALGRRLEEGINSQPHARKPDLPLKAVLRAIYYATDFLLGTPLVIRRANRSGRHFVLERGWGDMIIDPLRYGFAGSRYTRWYSRVLPRPDLLVIMVASTEKILLRKPELTAPEIQRQYASWMSWPKAGRRVVEVNNDGLVSESLAALMRELEFGIALPAAP